MRTVSAKGGHSPALRSKSLEQSKERIFAPSLALHSVCEKEQVDRRSVVTSASVERVDNGATKGVESFAKCAKHIGHRNIAPIACETYHRRISMS